MTFGVSYPMRLVTRLTGLSPDTIRAWERRYRAVDPARTEGNTRRYSAGQVRRLLLLREATRRGHSIGSVAGLRDDDLERLILADLPGVEVLVNAAVQGPEHVEPLVQAYVGSLARFAGREGYVILERAFDALERAFLVREVLDRIVREIERRWSKPAVGTAHQQLFIQHLHGLVGRGLRRRSEHDEREKRVLVATTAEERREMDAMLALLLIEDTPADPVYIGVEADVEWALSMSRADAVVIVTTQKLGPPRHPAVFSFDPQGEAEVAIRGWADLQSFVRRFSRAA
jgi:DNA-binding transcriptional MerR regulator